MGLTVVQSTETYGASPEVTFRDCPAGQSNLTVDLSQTVSPTYPKTGAGLDWSGCVGCKR